MGQSFSSPSGISNVAEDKSFLPCLIQWSLDVVNLTISSTQGKSISCISKVLAVFCVWLAFLLNFSNFTPVLLSFSVWRFSSVSLVNLLLLECIDVFYMFWKNFVQFYCIFFISVSLVFNDQYFFAPILYWRIKFEYMHWNTWTNLWKLSLQTLEKWNIFSSKVPLLFWP